MRIRMAYTIAMSIAVSDAQLTANRENGKKGGVKTAAGKAVSKMNALKHGLLAEHVIIQRGVNAEDEMEYESLREGLFLQFEPVGALENILVDQLFSLHWRLRRVPRAERALIEEAMLAGRIREEFAYIQKAINYDYLPDSEDIVRLEKYKPSLVCVELISDVRQIIHFIEEGVLPLPHILIQRIEANFGVAHQLSPQRETILACNEAIQTKQYHGKDEVYYKKEILVAAKELLELLKERATDFLRLEGMQFREQQETLLLPNERDVQRIQRYESSLQRGFFQTLHELQRVQNARLGNPAPLAAALDVNVNTENGFVS
jgi:hypothetical protein